MKKQWKWVYWLYIDQIKKDEETLHVIMSREGSVVNKFWTIFICNFRESLQYCIQTQNESGQPLWALKNYPQKMKREFFLQISKLRINKTHFKPE